MRFIATWLSGLAIVPLILASKPLSAKSFWRACDWLKLILIEHRGEEGKRGEHEGYAGRWTVISKPKLMNPPTGLARNGPTDRRLA